MRHKPIAKLWHLYQRKTLNGELPSLDELGLVTTKLSARAGRFHDSTIDRAEEALATAERLLQYYDNKKSEQEMKGGLREMAYQLTTREEKLFAACMEMLYAAERYDLETVGRLLENGVPPSFQNPANGFTALHAGATWQDPDHKLVEMLAETGRFNFLLRDHAGRTPYDLANVFNPCTRERLRQLTYAQAEQEGIDPERFWEKSTRTFEMSVRRGAIDAQAPFEAGNIPAPMPAEPNNG